MEIKNYSNYLIYKNGSVYSKNYNKFLKPTLNSWGYLQVSLWKNSKRKRHLIHRLVAEYYIPNSDNKPQVDHIDRNKQNNSILNLKWVNKSENGINSPIRGKIPFRHISIRSNGKDYLIQIQRNGKRIYHRYFKTNQYTLQELVNHRNTEVYPLFNITIDD